MMRHEDSDDEGRASDHNPNESDLDGITRYIRESEAAFKELERRSNEIIHDSSTERRRWRLYRWYLLSETSLQAPHIALPPGMLLDRVMRFLLTREAHRRYIAPVIADMRVEYCDALAVRELWHARWIAVRVYLLVVPGYLYGCVARVVKRMFSA